MFKQPGPAGEDVHSGEAKSNGEGIFQSVLVNYLVSQARRWKLP